MYTIMMTEDKVLTKTKVTNLYQGENLVDEIRFLLPLKYRKSDLAEFKVTLKYLDPANIAHSEVLVLSEDLYKNCMLSYYLPVSSELTKFAGDILMHLILTKGTSHTLHTSDISITIKPTRCCYQPPSDTPSDPTPPTPDDDCEDGYEVVIF